jgi:hypothetical protein
MLQLKDAYSRANLIASRVHKLLLYGTAEKIILYQTHSLTQRHKIAFTESQCYYKTIADLINGYETERCTTMSIGNNI